MDKTSLYRSFVANDNLIANYLAKKAAVILAKIISSKGKIYRSSSNIKNISNEVIIDDNKQTNID